MKFSLFFLIAILENILKSEAPSMQQLKTTYAILKYKVKINPTHFNIRNLNSTKKRDETKLN